ncbi:putaive hydrogenase [Yasminevirus sp. GU-2018]|uniref:Putaive hydrogenase n=1 Tax=Yasminevirus sp. GU-2018 TaxID=2420051 RepID=A0A5K0U952_9VIRU|nr:putaive hydrogenase [Yasminevirus sp. GU-2018]
MSSGDQNEHPVFAWKDSYVVTKVSNTVLLALSYAKLYIYLFLLKCVNVVLKQLGYTRVYDLTTGADLTMMYYAFKFLEKSNLPVSVDVSYSRLGVCTYIGDKYVRYVCYDSKITNVIRSENIMSSKNYHTIKKIEHLVNEDNENSVCVVDVTDSKYQLYDINNFTRPEDVVRFYSVMNGHGLDAFCKNSSIRIQREYFDDDMMEFISVSEEVASSN